ncbi:MAG: PilZ domain-containing protein [Elusimicrobiota bacterium]
MISKDNEILIDRRKKPFIRTAKRRQFDRRSSYRVVENFPITIKDANTNISGFIHNISDAGVYVEIDKKLVINNDYIMSIESILPNSIKVRVNWEKLINGKRLYGVEFLDLTDDDKQSIRMKILLKDDLFKAHANAAIDKIQDKRLSDKVKSFFRHSVKQAILELIEVDAQITSKKNSKKIQKQCEKILNTLVAEGDSIELLIDEPSIVKDIKHRVRALLGYFVYQAKTIKRAFEKPRGYPGDYDMLEIVYDNLEISDGIGKYIDRYFLNVPYADGIRRRKDKMRRVIEGFIKESDKEKLALLNLASGSCRELKEMIDNWAGEMKKLDVSCVDLDQAALDFSKKVLAKIDKNVNMRFINGNILELGKIEDIKNKKFDLIYSIGIADYLQDRIIVKILKECYGLLNTKGEIVIAYKDKDQHRPLLLNWYGDWYFIPRNENEVLSLIKNALKDESYKISIDREDTGVIFFVTIKKER